MHRPWFAPLVAAWFPLILSACTGPEPGPQVTPAVEEPEPAANPPTQVLASYVLLASDSSGQPAAYARVIQDDGLDCPTIAQDCSAGPSRPMTARDKPGFSAVEHCPDGGCFPVTVCEATVPFDQSSQVCLSGSAVDLPVPRMKPADILVMGDTGCKSASGEAGGACAVGGSDAAEPFGSLVKSTASTPDLILHMGDYNYRGTPGSVPWVTSSGKHETTHHPYDAGDGADSCEQAPTDKFRTQASSRSELPDQWAIWKKEFFDPAGKLLAASPWVFARGNHELCSRAGPGWFYFLDAGFKPDGTQRDCPGLGGDDHPDNPFLFSVIAPMYTVNLSELSIVVLDSANACDAGVPPQVDGQDNAFVAAYKQQFGALTVPQNTTWIMSHRPFWDNDTLQATSGNGASLAGISLSLAGHQHRFESYTPIDPTGFPREVVAGNGGVALSGDANECLEATIDEISVWKAGSTGHGFLSTQFVGATGAWSGTLTDASGNTLATCSSGLIEGSVCSPAVQPCSG